MSNRIQSGLQSISDGVKRSSGITPLTPMCEIGIADDGYSQAILSAGLEVLDGKTCIRISLRRQKSGGGAGGSTRAFAWPLDDNAAEWPQATGLAAVEQAVLPGARQFDSRSAIGRFFDSMIGTAQLNEVPEIGGDAAVDGVVAARITQEKHGKLIWLTHTRKGRGFIGMRLPWGLLLKLNAHDLRQEIKR